MSKLKEHMDLIDNIMMTSFPDIYNHLQEEEITIFQITCMLVMTAFVGNLQQCSPLIACHIFDVFLFDGESTIFTLLMKFIQIKETTIMELYDDDLTEYMMHKLPYECLA